MLLTDASGNDVILEIPCMKYETQIRLHNSAKKGTHSCDIVQVPMAEWIRTYVNQGISASGRREGTSTSKLNSWA